MVGLVGIPCVMITLFGLPHHFYGCLLLNCTIIILTQVFFFPLGMLNVNFGINDEI